MQKESRLRTHVWTVPIAICALPAGVWGGWCGCCGLYNGPPLCDICSCGDQRMYCGGGPNDCSPHLKVVCQEHASPHPCSEGVIPLTARPKSLAWPPTRTDTCASPLLRHSLSPTSGWRPWLQVISSFKFHSGSPTLAILPLVGPIQGGTAGERTFHVTASGGVVGLALQQGSWRCGVKPPLSLSHLAGWQEEGMSRSMSLPASQDWTRQCLVRKRTHLPCVLYDCFVNSPYSVPGPDHPGPGSHCWTGLAHFILATILGGEY